MTLAQTKEAKTEQLVPLMEENMGLVVHLAKSFNPRNDEELDEFIQLGRIGLWKAIEKHEPSRSKLSTTIWHYVRWEILRYLQKRNDSDVQLDESIPIAIGSNDVHIWEYIPDYLNDNEKEVIKLRLEGYNFTDIGKKLGYSRGWANNIFRTAITKVNDANS